MLKGNWAIRTPQEKFKVYRATLKALGYTIHSVTDSERSSMDGKYYLGIGKTWASQTVQRSTDNNHYDDNCNYFENMDVFLAFHFAEKTPQEKELDKLNQQLVELQAQIEVVKQSVKSI